MNVSFAVTKPANNPQYQGLFDPARLDYGNAESTRLQILLAAFEEIHEKGFQAASLANILSRTGLTKGALYHHFPNKTALGYAVVDELVAEKIRQDWQAPLEGADNPIDALIAIIEKAGDMIDSSICQQPFDGLPIWLRRIGDLVTTPADPHFVTLC